MITWKSTRCSKEYIKGKSLRRTKTDKLDAIAIAGYMLAQGYRPHQTSFYQKFSLKQLTRLRSSLVSQRSCYLVRMTNVLDWIFPEFKPLFGNKFSVTALYIRASRIPSLSAMLQKSSFA